MSCINCSKKRPYCFKSCTLDKSNTLKEYITNRLEQNERLQEELIMIIGPVESLKLQITEKEDRLIKLRSAIQESQQRILMKNKKVKKLNSIIKPEPEQSKNVLLSQSEYLKSLSEKKIRKREQLKIAEENLAKIRMDCFHQVFRIFPIKIEVVTESNNFEDWVIVNDNEPQEEQITIRNFRITNKLLTKLIEELAVESIHQYLTSVFTNTFQLVHLLIFIFNISSPKRLPSLRDLSIGDGKMSKDSLKAAWINLCDTVIHLCAHFGIPIDNLEISNPYKNLIELSKHLGTDVSNFMKI